MKIKSLFFALVIMFFASCCLTSCIGVDSGHEAAIISYGGETDTTKTLQEGLHWGFHYLWTGIVEYEVREQTVSVELSVNDKNDMLTPVQVTVYFTPQKGKVNFLHKNFGVNYVENKLQPVLSSSLAKVVPQYSATDLNKTKRSEAEQLLSTTISQETHNMYINIARVQLGKVGIPKDVADLAEQTAVQEGKNILAAKKEEEQIQLAKALVAKAQGEYDASVLDAKTRDLLSAPKMLDLQRIENEKIMWEGYKAHGKSPFGENNIFGGDKMPSLLLNRN